MLKRCWQARWYILLGLITFIITLALTTPLHFVWRYVEPQLQGSPVQISQVRGSLWAGRMQVNVPELAVLGNIQGQWQLELLPLLGGKAKLKLNLEGQDLRLKLPVSLSASTAKIEGGEGFLQLEALNSLLQQQRGSAQGQVELQQLESTILWRAQSIQNLAGRLTYTGGEISLLVDGNPVNAEMPPLVGRLGMEQERAVVDILTLENASLLQGYLQPDGWAGLSLKRRFLDVIGQQWPAKAEADTVIFEVSQKVM